MSPDATASKSSEKQCSSSFPYRPGTRDRKRGLAPSAVPVPVFDLVSPFSTRPRRAGVVEFVVMRKACTPSGCPNARVENGDRHRRRSQSPFSTAGCHKADNLMGCRLKNLSWGGGGSLPVVASTDAGSVESQETSGDTDLYSQNATASESSEKQCSSSFPCWPTTRGSKTGTGSVCGA